MTRTALASGLGFLLAFAPGGTATAGPCAPDTDGSGTVDVVDLLGLLVNWGPCIVPPPPCCDNDFNGDLLVDHEDLAELLYCFGPCPCPPPGGANVFNAVEVVTSTDPGIPAGLTVTRVYATGASVVIGDALILAHTSLLTPSPSYFQSVFGTNLPAHPVACAIIPEACYDTFVTMNLLTDDLGEILVSPRLMMDTTMISGSWFADPATTHNLAVDISAETGSQAGVLIAQLSFGMLEGPVTQSFSFSGDIVLYSGPGSGGSLTGETVQVSYSTCLYDCEAVPDDNVGILDFLALLGQWGQTIVSCDDDGGGVGITDFLDLLAHWGPCP